jgi:hypothetical protein
MNLYVYENKIYSIFVMEAQFECAVCDFYKNIFMVMFHGEFLYGIFSL